MGAGCIQVVLQIMVQFQKIYLLHAHGSLVYTLHVLQANLMIDWSKEGMRCLVSKPGCREVAAEERQHCLLLCTHT